MQLALFCYPTIPELPDQSIFFSQFVCQGPPQSVVLLETCPAVSMAGREMSQQNRQCRPKQAERKGYWRAVGWTLGGLCLSKLSPSLLLVAPIMIKSLQHQGVPLVGKFAPTWNCQVPFESRYFRKTCFFGVVRWSTTVGQSN